MTDKSVELTDVQLGSKRGGLQKTERSLYLEERAKYKVFCAGLSTTDLGISSGLLITLWGFVICLFLFFRFLVNETRFVKSNDTVLWIYGCFGLSYFAIVFGLIATDVPVDFKAQREAEEKASAAK
jgi:hypothetical protein